MAYHEKGILVVSVKHTVFFSSGLTVDSILADYWTLCLMREGTR